MPGPGSPAELLPAEPKFPENSSAALKEVDGVLQRRDEDIDFFTGVVEIQTGAGGGADPQNAVQGLGAVVARANGDARLIQQRG
jgi:hypothetical protein